MRDEPPSAFAIVQRHAYERTQVAGLELADRELPGATVTTVAAGDFPATLRACFEKAVELDRPWTLTVDGDVLLLPGSGAVIRQLPGRLPRRAGHLDLLVQDRVTGEARNAGVRLYRTSTMQVALRDGDWSGTLRPETHLLDSLGAIEKWSPAILVGLHDHEQYLRDLFRTALVMVRKKADQRERLVRLWSERADGPDDAALLAGAAAAARSDVPFAIDAASVRELADDFLAGAGLDEKQPLAGPPDGRTLEAAVPAAAQRLRRPSFAAGHLPNVRRKAGNGVRGRSLVRYAIERTRSSIRGR